MPPALNHLPMSMVVVTNLLVELNMQILIVYFVKPVTCFYVHEFTQNQKVLILSTPLPFK